MQKLNKNTLSPVCLFVYNRFFETKKTINALKKNYLSISSDLFIFSDGGKDIKDKESVNKVRKFLKSVSGFKSITIKHSETNKGLAHSIIEGVSKVISNYGKVIVVEDDLITSNNFLTFMNQSLDFYKENYKIHSISGYTPNLTCLKNTSKDYYLSYRASSWGWATWQKNWEKVDWKVEKYQSYRNNPMMQLKFMRGGSDLPNDLKAQINGKIDSWAIRWCFDQFIKNQLTIYPTVTKVLNIGIGEKATHTKNKIKLNTHIDNGTKLKFNFDNNLEIDRRITREFKRSFSFFSRLKNKFFK